MLPREPLSDNHTIETPEQMSLEIGVAGIGSRFLALAIDTLIQVAIFLLTLLIVFFFALSGAATGASQNWLLAFYVAVGFFLFYGYFAAFEILWNGQTPGKRLVGIRVIKDSGRPLTAGETIGRNLLRVVDQLPFFYVVGIVSAVLTPQNKRLGDLLVGSILVRETSLADLKPLWRPATESSVVVGSSSTLTIDDLTLIDTFLARRHSLSGDIRSRTAGQILVRLQPRLPADVDISQSPEALLEALSYEKRSAG
jgi:uncharacterized RDD family membrane protein YckC